MDLDGRSYVLPSHRGRDDAPVWRLALPTVGDVMAANAAAAKFEVEIEGEGESRRESRRETADLNELGVQLVARSLRGVDGLRRNGVELRFPIDEPMPARLEFVRGLPYAWLGQLGRAVQEDADVDSEDESGGVEARGGTHNGQAGIVRLPEMSSVATT